MLELKEISKIYHTKAQDVVALDKVNLYFEETGMVFITGKSGSGKTTLLNVIGGLDNFDGGELIIKNRSTKDFKNADYDSYRNTYIGFVFQEYNLIETMSIEKNLALATELQGKKKDPEIIKNILEKVDLNDVAKRKPQELSGGQRQRVAIARAIIKNPSIIMADEPTGALDTANGLQVMSVLKKLSKEKLVIVVSHDLELANRFADRIINLKDGRVESDITIKISKRARKNVLEKKDVLSIKRGANLKEKDLTKIKDAVKKGKEVVISENINIVKKKTKIEEKREYKDSAFYKTHMGVADTIKLGMATLKTKVFRLIITILLCAITFSVFGIFDSMAIYDEKRLAVNTLKASITPSITFNAQVSEGNNSQYDIDVNQGLIDSLSAQTKYDIKGVYNSYYMGSGSPVELKNKQLAKISKYYEFTSIYGAVEFTQEDIDKYGFNIVKGRLPQNFDEIAISEYYAYCLVNWWYGYTDVNGQNAYVEDIEELVQEETPMKLTLGTSNTDKKAYNIVGIIKTGEINHKFDKLKGNPTEETDKFEEASSLDQNEFRNYIKNGYFLYAFTCPGFADNALLEYNAPVQYKNDAFTFKFEDKNNKEISTQINKFYNYDEVKNYNVAFHFFDETKTALQDNEVMFDVSCLKTIYKDIYNNLIEVAKSDEELRTVVNNIESQISQLSSSKLSADEKIASVKEVISEMEYVQGLLDTANGVSRNEKLFDRVLVASKQDTSQAKVEIENREFKVVGFFAGLQSRLNSGSIVINTGSLNNLGININQGKYSTLIATNLGGGNFNKLSTLLYNSNGLGFECENVALATVKANGDFFENLSLIFLIASGVFAIFSIVMFSNFIATSIKNKYTEIGILRALGARGSDILWIFIVESLTLALINAVAACGLAYGGSLLVNMFLSDYLSLFIPLAAFGVRQVGIIFGLSLLVGIVSAALPIISISKQKPVETIRRAFD